MAYGTKYRFKFQNSNGVVYEVRLEERNYSGTVTDRPLGGAPVIHMQESGAFRSTSVDLTLECQVDGEFSFLYTSDPQKYKVLIYQNTHLLWQGFVATEIYSEPDIAPPYDVKVTATDGLGTLKEYDFNPRGARTIRQHLDDMLWYTGMVCNILAVTSLKEYNSGESYQLTTTNNFLNKALINLDFYKGKSIYDALEGLLKSLRFTITQWNADWLVIRTTDASVDSNGYVPAHLMSVTSSTPPYDVNVSYLAVPVGQRGATDSQLGVPNLWPVGYLKRRIVPAKNAVAVRSPWNYKNGLTNPLDMWTLTGAVSYSTTYEALVYTQPSSGVAMGAASSSVFMKQFVSGKRVRIKALINAPTMGGHTVTLSVQWGNYKYSKTDGWVTNAAASAGSAEVRRGSEYYDPNDAETVEFLIPPIMDTNAGTLTVTVSGFYVTVFSIEVTPDTGAGYEDRIIIDNDARGAASTLESALGTPTPANYEILNYLRGVLYNEWVEGSTLNFVPIYYLSDANNTNKDYLSLTALSCAKEYAAPRIEISGTLDLPSERSWQPLFIKSHGVWALMESYDWNLKEAEISFKAVTLPTATLTVDSETITSIPND